MSAWWRPWPWRVIHLFRGGGAGVKPHDGQVHLPQEAGRPSQVLCHPPAGDLPVVPILSTYTVSLVTMETGNTWLTCSRYLERWGSGRQAGAAVGPLETGRARNKSATSLSKVKEWKWGWSKTFWTWISCSPGSGRYLS